MKRMIICLLFIVISMTLVPAIWAQGNPFPLIQNLQNQINTLNTTVQKQKGDITALQNQVGALQPQQPINMVGCWKINAKGSFVSQLLIDPRPPANPSIFESVPAKFYLKVAPGDQSTDGSFTGTLYRKEAPTPGSAEIWVTIPAYGGTTGSSFYLYSTDPEDPPTQSGTEYRYYTGTKISDTSLFGIGCVFRVIDKNVPNWTVQHQSFTVSLDSITCP